MATPRKIVRLRLGLSTSVLAMTFLANDGFALNLKEAKTPIHYECQTTLSGGLWQDEKTGEWMSGKVIPHPGKYRMVLERFDNTKGKRKVDCTSEERRTGGTKLKAEDFCMTFVYSGERGSIEETRYCMITAYSSARGDHSSLDCPLGRKFFDSDRLYGVKTDSPEFVGSGWDIGRTVTADKFSCLRLDR